MKSFATLSLLVITLFFSSCDETKKVIDVAGNVQLSGNYTVNSIEGNALSAIKPSLSFAALSGRVSGDAGCNTYFADYSTNVNSLTIGEVASTKKACAKNIMQVENRFLETLANVGGYRIQDNVLTLYAKNDQSVLITATKNQEDDN
ncbi:META domain-containing protein [Marixanthomonas sp. SCSIO 43207]|uniref:META domain-containing protein n=1 Tax=Marixanthomonas sp. SCSIO 43207 TaxID=2779360 RepID=UPI001CA8C643|nr:META domain-containing protein [Marixanthomonas sp. SCSIO 43207]UAB81798.1 META domain-containing protein [Marixanthomonas sp. SCSIO 43207]